MGEAEEGQGMLATDDASPPRGPKRRLRIGGPQLAPIILAILAFPVLARPILDEDTERLLVDAVVAAAELDLYHSRCRWDVSGRRTDNLNKELVSRFRMTVLEVEDDLFPERSYRRARERLQRNFLDRLKDAGGCKGAKQSGMPQALRERYDALMAEIEALP
jgi:hypothetical protein